jgi:radical SAM-linked protein
MVKVFQRACVRAGIKIRHSQGFNPRPKLSLPLPRTVGVESDDDLLSLQMQASSFDSEQFKARLLDQLPDGCELLTVSVAKPKTSFSACAATYMLPVQQRYINKKLRSRIERLLASESLNLQRRRYPAWQKVHKTTAPTDTKDNIRNVDVRDFLKSVEVSDNGVAVECKISPGGTIRVDEILKLLELDTEMLAAPIRRTNVQWQSN